MTLGAMLLGPSLVWVWLRRRFGFLALLALFTFSQVMFMPHHLSGWLGELLLIWYVVPVAVAAWAVWVILSVRTRVPA